MVYYKWKKKTSKGVQIEFLCFLLVGLLMISIGGLTLALEPSTGTCTPPFGLVMLVFLRN